MLDTARLDGKRLPGKYFILCHLLVLAFVIFLGVCQRVSAQNEKVERPDKDRLATCDQESIELNSLEQDIKKAVHEVRQAAARVIGNDKAAASASCEAERVDKVADPKSTTTGQADQARDVAALVESLKSHYEELARNHDKVQDSLYKILENNRFLAENQAQAPAGPPILPEHHQELERDRGNLAASGQQLREAYEKLQKVSAEMKKRIPDAAPVDADRDSPAPGSPVKAVAVP